MQILKEEIREALINNAINEFHLNGYEKASLRKIIKNSGTTIGNFYNYFENKEELFYTITTPAYNDFVFFMKHHNNEEHMHEIKEIKSEEIQEVIKQTLNSIDEKFEKALLILIDGSKGTKYEKIKEEVQDLMAHHFIEHISAFSKDIDITYYEKFARIAAISFIEGFLNILRENFSREEKAKLITDHILFFTFGSKGLI